MCVDVCVKRLLQRRTHIRRVIFKIEVVEQVFRDFYSSKCSDPNVGTCKHSQFRCETLAFIVAE